MGETLFILTRMAMNTIIQGGFFLLMCGYVCEADLDQCSGKACREKNMCQVAHDLCTCKMGYLLNATTGICDDLDECANHFHDPCGHKGRCNNTVGSYTCECLQGWTQKEHCTLNYLKTMFACLDIQEKTVKTQFVETMATQKALNVNEFMYACICYHTVQSTNATSAVHTSAALLYTCQLKAECSYTCDCYPPWTGRDCSAYNCTIEICHNGGTCEVNVCACVYPWTGPNCAEQINNVHADVTTDQNTNLLDALHVSDRIFLYLMFGVAGLLLLVVVVLSRCLCQTRSRSKKISASSQQITECEM